LFKVFVSIDNYKYKQFFYILIVESLLKDGIWQ